MTDTGQSPSRVCPGCQSAMQTFRAGEVELERCFFCGGVFLDKGELDQVVGKPVDLAPGNRPGERICAGCGGTLAPSRAGAVTVDLCPSCEGIYLDAGELESLAGAVKLARADAGPTREAITFVCPGCGERLDASLGQVTGRGLACASCAPALGDRAGGNILSGGPPGASGIGIHPGDPGSAELKTLNLVLLGLRLFLGR